MITAVTTRRPKLVWAIALWSGLAAVFGLLLTIATYSGIVPRDEELHKLLASIPPNYVFKAVHLADLIVMGVAAFLLFRLRKSAVVACGITFGLELAVGLIPFIDGHYAQMGFSDWAIHRALIIEGVFNVMLPFAIFLYVRRLREKGVLT